ncbi:MAG: hypothetical protein K2Q22_06630 [Cytophagales bacterium]|nr:hypothetical protein [Cytophagales bacterium]
MIGIPIVLRSNDIVSSDSPLIAVLLLCGFFLPLIYFYFGNHGNRIYSIQKDGLLWDNSMVKWTEMISYKIKNDSPEFKVLQIKTRTNGIISIGHRKRHEKRDDFETLLAVFESNIHEMKNEGVIVEESPLIWDKPTGKIYGYLLIVILILFGLEVFISENQVKAIIYLTILFGSSLPILYRVFNKKK